MKIHDLQSTFFFDLPLSDVYGVGCTALRLIYHGSERGVFGNNTKEAFDLSHVQAFQISLKHLTVEPLSDQYEYHMVYYRKELGMNLWNNRFRKGCPILRALTRRVKFSDKRSLEPNRLMNLYIKSDRPVHIAQYNGRVPTDDYVPKPYIVEFGHLFEGFLMRSKRDYQLVTNLFAAQGLALTERRDMSATPRRGPHVLAFTDMVEMASEEDPLDGALDGAIR